MTVEPHILDVRGDKCPIPIKKLRDTIRETPEGSKIHLLTDDLESRHDVPALLRRLNMPPALMIEAEVGIIFKIENQKL
jgi:TusA-related sulfurtransferase|tara:strand:+ start:447 stop:683 length:237 start_codon:yes stop_codon:yes gene_type:complete